MFKLLLAIVAVSIFAVPEIISAYELLMNIQETLIKIGY